ncbi:MAG: efflux RND transporter periplasmic adaptor subunit [Rhodocyclaceae bacterium]|nr:efflux RND transporter periplasmic adaptor subunit [Rhodocyclaceae bacterium]MCW5615154.1 efflux RND transporter periplasmic adaptor subunit [Rhodocyclaceae bacterium]
MSTLLRRSTVVILIAALAAGIWWYTRPKPVSVVLATVGKGVVEATVANTRAGEVESCRRARLAPLQGGRIDFIGVEEGDRVRQGQVLMRLWNEDQQAQEAVSDAQRTSSEKRVAEVCTLAANAARDARRQMDLKARGFVSASAAERAQADADSRAAACATARADVLSASARIQANRAEQRRSVLRAPFDGTIAKITGKLGEYATPSPPGVATPPAIDLIDESCLYVRAPMDEVDAPKIQPGQTVRVTIDALPGKVFAARVKRIAPYVAAVEKQARTVDVDVDFVAPEAARGLLVGYSADAEVILEVRPEVLRVPTAALREGNTVLRLGSDEVLEVRAVQTGIANWEFTEITAGLEAGDRIVTSLEREGVGPGVAARPDAPVANGR